MPCSSLASGKLLALPWRFSRTKPTSACPEEQTEPMSSGDGVPNPSVTRSFTGVFPDGHKSQATESQLVRLDDDQLKISNKALEDAALALGKTPPRRPYISRLLQRNYYQVAWSEACYAVTVIREDVLPGGTAWATTMFAQLHPENRRLYIFDQEKDAWFQWNGATWDQIDSPPRPTGIWAGIGSRDLRQNGRDAIRKLMGCDIV